MATKLRNNRFMHPLFVIRDLVMEKSGLFGLKKLIKQKILFHRLIKEDAAKKREIDRLIFSFEEKLFTERISNEDFVISLTSYGKRVYDALPYSLFSLLTQTILPSKIVVYLDNENWSDDKLPAILKQLQKIGIDFRYCEDIKSYKKLIPALFDFPDNPIITMDDDFYYNPKYMEWMIQAYAESDKKTVLGQWGCIPKKEGGKYIPYSLWDDCKNRTSTTPISFYGCCCCYPPHIFDGEILKKEIFMKLCPTADDIWFWLMEERQNIKRAYIKPCGYGFNIPVNRIEEYDLSQKNTLMYQNVKLGKNDEQLRAILNYYSIENNS